MGKSDRIVNLIFVSQPGFSFCDDASDVMYDGVGGINWGQYSIDFKKAETGSGARQQHYYHRNDRYSGVSDISKPGFFAFTDVNERWIFYLHSGKS